MNGTPDQGRGVLILVLGILSLITCAFLGPFAWMMGSADMKKIAAGEISEEARGMTQAGMICGIIGTVFLGLGILIGLVWLLLVVVGLGLSAGS